MADNKIDSSGVQATEGSTTRFFLFAGAILLGFVVLFGTGCAEKSAEEKAQEALELSAKKEGERVELAGIRCKHAVKDRLKAPSSADFPWGSPEAEFSDGRHVLTISSYVDAQNSFGVSLRTNFLCRFQYSGSGEEADIDNWKLEEVTLN